MCWLTDVIIPIVCALIGGGLTMWGVQLTLKAQRIKTERIRIQEARPYLFAGPTAQKSTSDKIQHLPLKTAEGNSLLSTIHCYVKNSDNSIAVVKKVTSENNTYLPTEGNLIDKCSITDLNVFLADKNEKLTNWKLFIDDIYGNEYCYQMILDGTMLTIGACVESEKSQKEK